MATEDFIGIIGALIALVFWLGPTVVDDAIRGYWGNVRVSLIALIFFFLTGYFVFSVVRLLASFAI